MTVSIGCKVTVPGFAASEIGGAFVRAYPSKLQVTLKNDGVTRLGGLSVRLVLESYVGQEKPILFQWAEKQVVEEIASKESATLEFECVPRFPGLASVACYVADAAGDAVKVKRPKDASYGEPPVRWYFHVIDDISIETLRALKRLQETIRNQTKK